MEKAICNQDDENSSIYFMDTNSCGEAALCAIQGYEIDESNNCIISCESGYVLLPGIGCISESNPCADLTYAHDHRCECDSSYADTHQCECGTCAGSPCTTEGNYLCLDRYMDSYNLYKCVDGKWTGYNYCTCYNENHEVSDGGDICIGEWDK